jgi:hypothetical protein
MAEQYGYIKISRKAYEVDPFWTERRVFSKWEAWEDLIQLAAWKPYRKMIGLASFELQRGEFLASIRYLAKRWCWGEKKVRGFIDTLSVMGRISARARTHEGHTYLLVNYDLYQAKGTAKGTGEDTPRAQSGHKEEGSKEVKEEGVSESELLFELAWKAYPARSPNPKKLAKKNWDARVAEGVEPRDLIAAVDRYAKWCRAKKKSGDVILMASTFFGPNERWKDDYSVEDEHGRRRDAVGGADQGAGGPKRGKYDHLTVVSGAEPAA